MQKAARKRTLKQIVTTITNQARKGPASAGTCEFPTDVNPGLNSSKSDTIHFDFQSTPRIT